MHRRTVLVAAGAGLAVSGGLIGWELFAPEATTVAREETTGTVLKSGTFVGKANHECSGTVELVATESGLALQFRDYEQTAGPDVFCYLTPDPDPDTRPQIEAGTKVRIDGGADGGEMTKTGTFAQPLADIDPDTVRGVGIWCDRFAVPFGAATLE